jgi:hypothetical protein
MATETYGEGAEPRTGAGDDPERLVYRGRRRRPRRGRVRISAVVAVVAAVAFVAWLIARNDDSSPPPTAPPVDGGAHATIVSARGLRALSQAAHEPIYWVGPRAGSRYELTRTRNGRTYVRYLPRSEQAGSDKPYLTIGTYALPNAYAATRVAARGAGARRFAVAGGVAFYSTSRPTSVYVAFSGSNYQVEVYAPDPAVARRLVRAGAVDAVTPGAAGSAASSVRIVSVRGLADFAQSVGHRVYWAGAIAGTRYEATAATGGNAYVRYLPAGVSAGAPQPYLTIGTYPLNDAYKVTSAVLRMAGARRVTVPDGIGVYSATRPNNVYVAFPGSPYQIEVFSLSPAQARRIAARLAPLG